MIFKVLKKYTVKSLPLPGPHPPKFLCDLQEIISFTIFLYVLSKLCQMYADYLNIHFPFVGVYVCVCVCVNDKSTSCMLSEH